MLTKSSKRYEIVLQSSNGKRLNFDLFDWGPSIEQPLVIIVNDSVFWWSVIDDSIADCVSVIDFQCVFEHTHVFLEDGALYFGTLCCSFVVRLCSMIILKRN